MPKKKLSDRGWCYNCGYDGYVTHELLEYASFDEYGQPIETGPTYKYIEAYCPKCNTLVEVESIRSENIKRKRQAEMDYYGLVSHSDLLKLPKMYGVSRRQIEEILDLESELMLRKEGIIGVSIWDGELLSSAESERVKKALSSPEYFLDRMNAIKDSLPKELYEKASNRIKRKNER